LILIRYPVYIGDTDMMSTRLIGLNIVELIVYNFDCLVRRRINVKRYDPNYDSTKIAMLIKYICGIPK